MTLEMCTLYKGVPHGMALIDYKDPTNKYNGLLSFRGLGIFQHGQLHNTPFTCLRGGEPEARNAFTVAKMANGRPADGSYLTKFVADGCKFRVDSSKEETDVGGR